jgi:hypothetical protein
MLMLMWLNLLYNLTHICSEMRLCEKARGFVFGVCVRESGKSNLSLCEYGMLVSSSGQTQKFHRGLFHPARLRSTSPQGRPAAHGGEDTRCGLACGALLCTR